ncbi:MAG: protein-export chaperone SecB [Butyrivibrio sp.]|jgi:preprotein translocase subunit SecB|nr:protein-export chaperone SecB [Butyrivibrio sp.]
MNGVLSVLKYKSYVVEKIEFLNNDNFLAQDEGIELKFDFDADFDMDERSNDMAVILQCHIFENAEANNYPFEMNVVLKGFFEIEGSHNNIDRFKSNALAILFPYLRALISSFTANANVAPIILPAININAFLDSKK